MPGREEMRLQEEDRDTGRLVARFKAGEERAFDLLYLRYFDRVYEHLPEGKATVGFQICIKHAAAAAEGARCQARAILREFLDNRKLRFEVEVTEGDRTIGIGTHERRIVDTAAFGD